MNFSTADAVGQVIYSSQQAELLRGRNRVLVQELFNGFPPYTDAEVEENGISVNINWKEGTNLLWAARRQYENAFLKPARFFTVNLTRGDPKKRRTWSRDISRRINKVMKRSARYLQLHRSRWAGVCLHGTGAQLWGTKNRWLADFVPIEDLLLPTDLECDFSNFCWAAIRREYTVGELWRMTHGRKVDPRWNIPLVDELIAAKRHDNTDSNSTWWSESPEKQSELYKQNSALFQSDKAPTIRMWDFYHMEDEDVETGVYRKMVVDREGTGPSSTDTKFVYDGWERPFAKGLSNLLHVQFGDGNIKPPFLYHSVRSIGFMLFDVCSMSNRLKCQQTQHVFESLNMLFRIHDPNDREKARKVLLAHRQVIEPGIEIIPREQRHQIDAANLELLTSQYRQLMGESTSSYTQQPDTGTKREQTATEFLGKVQQLNALMSSMLATAYIQETFAYEEICRRFCIKDAGDPDPDVKVFQDQCREDGVPDDLLDVKHFEIEPEQVLGGGNKMIEIALAERLLAVRNLHGPEAQGEILHIYDEAILDNAGLAEVLAPTESTPKVTDAIHDAELSFGTLMQGVPVSIKEGLNQIEEVESLLRLAGIKVQQIQMTGGVGTQSDVIGLQTVSQHIGQRIQLIAMDENEKGRVKAYSDVLGRLDNEVKAFAQRQQQAAQQASQQPNPEAIQKLQIQGATAQQKLKSKALSDRQKLAMKQADFASAQQRKDVETAANIARMEATTLAEVHNQSLKTAAAEAAARAGEGVVS